MSALKQHKQFLPCRCFLVLNQNSGSYIKTHHHTPSPIVPDDDLLLILEMCDDHDAHVITHNAIHTAR